MFQALNDFRSRIIIALLLTLTMFLLSPPIQGAEVNLPPTRGDAASSVPLATASDEPATLWAPNGVDIKTVDVTGQRFKKTVSIRVANKPANPWESQTIYNLVRTVPQGAAMIVRFMARSTDVPVKGSVTFKEQGTNQVLGDQEFTLGREWTQIEAKFQSRRAARAKIELNLGHQVQTLEVGGFEAFYTGGDEASVAALHRAAQANSPAGGRPQQTLPPGGLYAKLKQEFGGVGNAYFVLGDSDEEALNRFGDIADGTGARVKPLEKFNVQIQPFQRAMRLQVDKPQLASMWDTHTATSNKYPVYKGEMLLLTFRAR